MRAMRFYRLILILCLGSAASVFAADDPLDKYNVVWTTPSQDCNGSMPIGNGETGLNAWVEPTGDLVMLCSRTDCWDENMSDTALLKLGRVRIKFTPPLTSGPFGQTLRLRQGEIEIQGGPADAPIKVRVWPDAHHQVAHIEAESVKDFQIQVALETWRASDSIVTGQKNRIAWYHRNPTSPWKEMLEQQHLQAAIALGTDPLLHRTFGGLIEGQGLVRVDDKTLKTAAPGKQFRVAIHTHTMTPATEAQWLAAIEKSAAAVETLGIESARVAHRRWWNDYWNRSWIRASGTPSAEAATLGYVLQRFVSAGAGRGHYPIKFNGSIFTVDGVYQGVKYGPDFRLWGGGYWFQNTRLVYWPMLASGDFEMMRPLFRMYEEALPLARVRSRAFFDHDGCYFPETVTFFGTYQKGMVDWKLWKKGDPANPPIVNGYIRYYFCSALELLAMMTDYYAYTGDKEFLRKELLPVADEFLTWWDKHWPRDATGKMKMSPTNALETYWHVTKPSSDIAGLMWNIDRLLALSDEEIGAARRARWSELRGAVPPLPTMTRGNKKVIAPAEPPLPSGSNSENPELYTVFPFRIFGVGKPGLQLALDTFNTRLVASNVCWHQDDTQAAMLGLASLARDYVTGRAQHRHVASRFPAFWDPGNDWVPDQDHGGNLLMAMQAMLIQGDAGRIHVLPAWPKDWDVEFKLRAPQDTIVEGTVRGGKLLEITTAPDQRKKDLVIHSPQ